MGTWDLSPQTRGQTIILSIERQILNHRPSGKPQESFLKCMITYDLKSVQMTMHVEILVFERFYLGINLFMDMSNFVRLKLTENRLKSVMLYQVS